MDCALSFIYATIENKKILYCISFDPCRRIFTGELFYWSAVSLELFEDSAFFFAGK